MAEAKNTKAPQPTSYNIDYLMQNAAVFKVPPEIIRGALHGKKTATKEEAEAAIKAYMKRPTAVKEGDK